MRERIGYVSQAGGATVEATGRENLVLQGRLYGMGKARARDSAGQLLDVWTSPRLPGGSSRPTQAARSGASTSLWACHEPALLFLDEPTTGLDPQSRARLWEEVRRLRREGTTVFLTTHYMDEADALCERLAIIDDGEIVAEDTPEALKRRISGDIVTLGLQEADGALKQVQELLGSLSFIRETEAAEGGLRLYVEDGEQSLPAILRSLDGAGLGVREMAFHGPHSTTCS